MTVQTIIEELRSTTSRNKKLQILQKHANNPILHDILYRTYHPHKMFNLSKVKIDTVGTKTIEDTYDDWKLILDRLEQRIITGNNARRTVKSFLEQCDKFTQNIYINMLKKKIDRLGVNVKALNKCGFNIPESIVQLAESLDVKRLDKYEKVYYITNKLNGIRCVYIRDEDRLLSRRGKSIVGFDHILKECRRIAKEYDLALIDGELYNDNLTFEHIQSIVRTIKNTNSETKQLLQFRIFALDANHIYNTSDMIKLLELIKDEHDKNTYQFVNPLHSRKMELTLDNVVSHYLNVAPKYEGIMLRHPHLHYTYKRSQELIKVKYFTMLDIAHNDEVLNQLSDNIRQKLINFIKTFTFQLDDYIIVDMLEGQGEFKGTLGAIVAEHKLTHHKIKVGSGFTKEQRKDIWCNKDKYIGKEIIVKFQDYTSYKNLSFPVFVSVKML